MTVQRITIRLSKAVALAAPDEAYLVSNCYSESTAKSIFEEIVVPLEDREQQWERVVAAQANHRNCRFFNNKKEYQDWLDKALHG